MGGIHASSEPAGASELQPADFSPHTARKQACTWEPGTPSPDLQTTEEIARSAFWNSAWGWRHESSQARGQPLPFPLAALQPLLVLSVAQSKTVRYSTFEEDASRHGHRDPGRRPAYESVRRPSFRLMKQFNSSLIRGARATR